jgi:hypothetical protein
MTVKEKADLLRQANEWYVKARETRNETYTSIGDGYRWSLNDDAPEFVKDIEKKFLYYRLSPKQLWALACNVGDVSEKKKSKPAES